MIKGFTVHLLLVVLLTFSLFAGSENTKKDAHVEEQAKDKKTVSLVLGSGGARGYAHIGAIEMIEKQGYVIDIPRDACEFYEFDKAYELIEIGKMAARESLKNIK